MVYCILNSLTRSTRAAVVQIFAIQSKPSYFHNMSKKTALLLLANGAEEMEAVVTADVLRRAEIQVTVCSINDDKCVKCSRGINICADNTLNNVKKDVFDVVILPGGLVGSENLAKSVDVGKLLQDQEMEGRVIAAICAAPTALKAHNVAKGKNLTAYPSMKDRLMSDYKYSEDIVVTDGNLITSQGPATSFAFALAIVEKLLNKETATKVANGLLYKNY